MAPLTPEKQSGHTKSPEAGSSVVIQPPKIESHLEGQLGDILTQVNQMTESSREGPGEQWSGSGGAVATTGQGSGAPAVSARDQAIAAIPPQKIMQKQLEQHIRMEVKKLRKQAVAIARLNRPGAAFRLNQLYARIHQLNALLSALLQSSYDAAKRLFIKVFIDRQPIL